MSEKGIKQDITTPDLDLGGVAQITGDHEADGLRFAIVVSRYNDAFTGSLLNAAVDALRTHGAGEKDIDVVWVPGAYEIPFMIERMLQTEQYHAAIALGVVIDGETRHGELITKSATNTLAAISRTYQRPVIDGVMTAYTIAQVEDRCAGRETNRGWYCALAAVEMARVQKRFFEVRGS